MAQSNSALSNNKSLFVPSPVPPENRVGSLHVHITLPNKLIINVLSEVGADVVRRCIVHGRGPQYSIEATHQCVARNALYEKLIGTVPTLIPKAQVYHFRTLNMDKNPGVNCLFDGIHLELQIESRQRPEFGFCFPRSAFVAERDAFAALKNTTIGTWDGWTHREPADSDRLRINKGGYEILYIAQPPLDQENVTISHLQSEIGRTLGITSLNRIIMMAGPFVWNSQFQDDGRDVYDTYFRENLVYEDRHMKTFRGSALIYVFEN